MDSLSSGAGRAGSKMDLLIGQWTKIGGVQVTTSSYFLYLMKSVEVICRMKEAGLGRTEIVRPYTGVHEFSSVH